MELQPSVLEFIRRRREPRGWRPNLPKQIIINNSPSGVKDCSALLLRAVARRVALATDNATFNSLKSR